MSCPELAFLRFEILTEVNDNKASIAQATFPVSGLRQGEAGEVLMLLSTCSSPSAWMFLLLLFLHHHLKPLFFYSVLKNKCTRKTFNQYSSAFRLSELLANTSKYIVNNKTNCIYETFDVRNLTNCWLYNSLYCLCSLWCMFEFIVSYFTVYCLDSYWKGPKINLQPSVLPPVYQPRFLTINQLFFFIVKVTAVCRWGTSLARH